MKNSKKRNASIWRLVLMTAIYSLCMGLLKYKETTDTEKDHSVWLTKLTDMTIG
ncbi:hypothetical protein [Reichenbachiella sp. 5M10]|uniref:hypothetical protein n=1 Tax=Reichenbachiella sp. 5M10 TaxID=1889772 RepID=UPI0013042993|nr:hypothetical protein [Reichenbachiella sp. 5M10]